MSADSKVKAPFGPPDCPWKEMYVDTAIPETVVYRDAKLDGDEVYIGRVYDGQCIYVGTAIPKKQVCIYLDKNSELKSSPNYEILTMGGGDPLCFQDMDLDNRNIFVAGIETNKKLYVGEYLDGNNNTYYGWISKTTRSIHIPRDSSNGPQVLDKDFGVLIHKYLDLLCICPPCRPFPLPPTLA